MSKSSGFCSPRMKVTQIVREHDDHRLFSSYLEFQMIGKVKKLRDSETYRFV
jgi:hypothetical protein